MKLSIIVPIYNVEQYLVRCLESLVVEMCDDSSTMALPTRVERCVTISFAGILNSML